MFDEESAKASDLDAISPGKCSPDRRKNGFDNTLDILELEIGAQLSDPSDQFRFCHRVLRLTSAVVKMILIAPT